MRLDRDRKAKADRGKDEIERYEQRPQEALGILSLALS